MGRKSKIQEDLIVKAKFRKRRRLKKTYDGGSSQEHESKEELDGGGAF